MDLASELHRLASLPPQLAIAEAHPTLDRVEPEHLPSAALAPAPGQPSISTVHADRSGRTLQVFVWPAGVWTPIHDHASWGIYMCLDGRLIEDRFTREDDGSQFSRAHLRQAWRRVWR